MTGEPSSGNDHTLLARVDTKMDLVLSRLDDICKTQDDHDERIRKLEVEMGQANVKIGIGATLAGIASAIAGIFIQKP